MKTLAYEDWNHAYLSQNDDPAKESETKWIPVTERLPETDKAVLCTVQGYKDERLVFTDCRYKNDRWESLDEPNYDYWTQLDDVLAWMPLPEPY